MRSSSDTSLLTLSPRPSPRLRERAREGCALRGRRAPSPSRCPAAADVKNKICRDLVLGRADRGRQWHGAARGGPRLSRTRRPWHSVYESGVGPLGAGAGLLVKRRLRRWWSSSACRASTARRLSRLSRPSTRRARSAPCSPRPSTPSTCAAARAPSRGPALSRARSSSSACSARCSCSSACFCSLTFSRTCFSMFTCSLSRGTSSASLPEALHRQLLHPSPSACSPRSNVQAGHRLGQLGSGPRWRRWRGGTRRRTRAPRPPGWRFGGGGRTRRPRRSSPTGDDARGLVEHVLARRRRRLLWRPSSPALPLELAVPALGARAALGQGADEAAAARDQGRVHPALACSSPLLPLPGLEGEHRLSTRTTTSGTRTCSHVWRRPQRRELIFDSNSSSVLASRLKDTVLLRQDRHSAATAPDLVRHLPVPTWTDRSQQWMRPVAAMRSAAARRNRISCSAALFAWQAGHAVLPAFVARGGWHAQGVPMAAARAPQSCSASKAIGKRAPSRSSRARSAPRHRRCRLR